MEGVVLRLPAGATPAAARRRAAGLSALFGRELLVVGTGTALRTAARQGEVVRSLPHAIDPARLFLVVQKGRLFQREHPDVRVLLDKGRFLAVELDTGHPALAVRDEPCWVARPLAERPVVFAERTPPPGPRATADWLRELVAGIDANRYAADLTALAAHPTRHSTSPHFLAALAWAEGELAAAGFATRREAVQVGAAASANLVAERRGGGPDAGLVVIVAHLDSVNSQDGPDAAAPGADDNASGSAGLLALARALACFPAVHDLRLILFGGEEQGLLGSRQHVAALAAADRARLRAVVNMDMIATLNTPSPTVLIEGAPLSQPLIDGLAEAAAAHTGLVVQTSLNPFASDHVPFIEAGLPAVLTIEGADGANERIHTADDVPAWLTPSLAVEILRMNLAHVATRLERKENAVPDRPSAAAAQPPAAGLTAALADLLRVTFSGRYTHNGGVPGAGPAPVLREEPDTLHRLEEPIFAPEPPTAGPSPVCSDAVRLTLHIDVDGDSPLDVVSGTVQDAALPGAPAHFIGRITGDGPAAAGRDLVVEDFGFAWPGTAEPVNRLELRLSGMTLQPARAEATFVTASGQRRGPFAATQVSRHFREIEVEVDREDEAVDPEPYDTHAHPDRPADLPRELLTLESTFAKAGLLVTRSGGGNVIETREAGTNSRWNEQELHDAMEAHWSAFGNRPQWKLWIFLAELADSDTLGGIMFDGDIDEPGGVDRQGTALFTKSPHFHTAAGAYPQANPPAAEAARRELFFDLIHEAGHAFNLAHSFQKSLGVPWPAPAWMPVTTDPQALSWMNYPDEASPGGGSAAKWFYDRFRFTFDRNELLFLRHAPERFVQMGNAAWFASHGRVAASTLDRRLKLELRARKTIYELGEPVTLEVKLANIGATPMMLHGDLDLHDGFLELAITAPGGRRRPFLPFRQARALVVQRILAPGEAVYAPLNLAIGLLGSPFKQPGAYRIEAAYRNRDGGTAAAVMQLYVRPPAAFDDYPVVNELFGARTGRVLSLRGTRIMEDVLDRLDWVLKHLGEAHPARYALLEARVGALAEPFKLLTPGSRKVRVADADPEAVVRTLDEVVQEPARAADALGHICFRALVERYSDAAAETGRKAKARAALKETVTMFKERDVIARAVAAVEDRLRQLS